MSGGRNNIAYPYVHILLALRLPGFTVLFKHFCSREQGWILGEANKAVVSVPPFFRVVAEPSLRLSRLVFALFCLKADEPLWSRKLLSKSYVFQNKAKTCVKGGPLTTLMRKQRKM